MIEYLELPRISLTQTSTSMSIMTMTDVLIDHKWEESVNLKNFILNESDNGTLFHRPLFLQYHGKEKFPDMQPIEISFFKKEKLIGCISGAVQRSNGEKKFISPFASSYGGLVFHRDLSFKEIEDLYLELLDYLLKEYSQVQIASTPFFQSKGGKSQYIDHILLNNGFSIIRSDIILVHELDSQEKLLARVHKKTYTELKQPLYKNKLRLEVTNGVDRDSYRLLANCQERLQSKPTHTYNELQVIENLIPGTIKTFKIYSGDIFLGGIITFHVSTDILSTFYVFDTPEGRALKANHFAYYNVLKYAFENEYSYVDFGSSSFGWRPNYPLISFKEKFDGKPFLRNIFGKQV